LTTAVEGEAIRQSVASFRVVSVRDGRRHERNDALTVEEPLEIRAAGPGQPQVRVAVTMRTPGHDFELAAGFLVTEGLVAPDAVQAVAYCEEPDAQHYNVVTVRTRGPFDLGAAERHFFATSSCGICGKASLEAIKVRCAPLTSAATIVQEVVLGLPDTLRDRQRLFGKTGGLHAAGLFDTSGELVVLREDVGRHNAVDKVVGARVLGTVPAGGDVMLVSGRLSFEIVQKAAVAGIPIACAISAPSTLAVAAADELGVTTVGFLRPDGFNVYTHPERILLDEASAPT
jgi:FdhD protein